MTLQQAESFVTKEVMYHNLTGILSNVRAIADGRMILGYTDTGIVINIVLYKAKNEKDEWQDIEELVKPEPPALPAEPEHRRHKVANG